MPEQSNWKSRLRQLPVPVAILLMAAGVVFLIAGNWTTWASSRLAQETDDAYVRADVTPVTPKHIGFTTGFLSRISGMGRAVVRSEGIGIKQ